MNGIVYAGSSIRKCSNPANLSQNTSIKNQKSARSKPFNENISKPMPNKTTESCGQKNKTFNLVPSRARGCLKVFDINDNLFFATSFTILIRLIF